MYVWLELIPRIDDDAAYKDVKELGEAFKIFLMNQSDLYYFWMDLDFRKSEKEIGIKPFSSIVKYIER